MAFNQFQIDGLRTLIDALDSLIIFKRKAAFKARCLEAIGLGELFPWLPTLPGGCLVHPR